MRDKLKDKMTEVSDSIFQHPELSKHEEQSSRALADFLEQEGFTVKWELAGFRTAFVAEWGSGQPIIGFLAEYDALPGLAQEPVSRHCPKEGPGHGCGHNLIGTSAAGAGIVLKEVMEKHEIGGVLKVLGTPAEEKGSGKAIMVRHGVFEGIDAALLMHPCQMIFLLQQLHWNSPSKENRPMRQLAHGREQMH